MGAPRQPALARPRACRTGVFVLDFDCATGEGNYLQKTLCGLLVRMNPRIETAMKGYVNFRVGDNPPGSHLPNAKVRV